MKNEKLAKAKNAIDEFYHKHYVGICNAALIGTTILATAGAIALACHLGKTNIETVAGCNILSNDDDEFAVVKDDILFIYEPQSVAETIEDIKENGFAITEQGLDVMKAIIDNHDIVY